MRKLFSPVYIMFGFLFPFLFSVGVICWYGEGNVLYISAGIFLFSLLFFLRVLYFALAGSPTLGSRFVGRFVAFQLFFPRKCPCFRFSLVFRRARLWFFFSPPFPKHAQFISVLFFVVDIFVVFIRILVLSHVYCM